MQQEDPDEIEFTSNHRLVILLQGLVFRTKDNYYVIIVRHESAKRRLILNSSFNNIALKFQVICE